MARKKKGLLEPEDMATLENQERAIKAYGALGLTLGDVASIYHITIGTAKRLGYGELLQEGRAVGKAKVANVLLRNAEAGFPWAVTGYLGMMGMLNRSAAEFDDTTERALPMLRVTRIESDGSQSEPIIVEAIPAQNDDSGDST